MNKPKDIPQTAAGTLVLEVPGNLFEDILAELQEAGPSSQRWDRNPPGRARHTNSGSRRIATDIQETGRVDQD